MDVIANLRLRTDQVAKIRKWKGVTTDASLAAAMGADPGNVSRVLRGRQAPGPQFIASLALALDADLDDIFEMVADDEPEDAVA